ncbi:MAG: hypothetical protein GY853_14300, partial [PVC group bacterium]|nr:hypothetical protein [PVC group bacterium]
LWAHKTSPQSCSGEDKLPSQVIKDLATVYKEFIASPAQKELEELKKEISKLIQKITTEPTIDKYVNVFLNNLRDDNYYLLSSIAVLFEKNEDGITACFYDVNLFGYGDDEEEAIDDLCASIIDYYISLKENVQNLGPQTKKHWGYLDRIIKEEKKR